VPEKSSARVLHHGLRGGADCGALFGELVSVLLRRRSADDSGAVGSAAEIPVIILSRQEYTVSANMG